MGVIEWRWWSEGIEGKKARINPNNWVHVSTGPGQPLIIPTNSSSHPHENIRWMSVIQILSAVYANGRVEKGMRHTENSSVLLFSSDSEMAVHVGASAIQLVCAPIVPQIV